MIRLVIPKIKIFEPFLGVYFIWYYLPITRGYLNSGIYNKLFFSFFLMGCACLIGQLFLERKSIYLKKNILLPVSIYMVILVILYICGVGDAADHIRVSFTFWGTTIVFYAMMPYEDARKRFTKLLFLLLFITLLTSLTGVISNPDAARTLTYAANSLEEDLALKRLNIGGISFFQSLVTFVPIFVTSFLENKRRVFSIVALVLIFISLMSASFTISLLMFFIALGLGYLVNTVSVKRKIVVVLVLLIIFFVPWMEVISFIADNIPNENISARLSSIVASSLNDSAVGKLGSRLNLYAISFKTFLKNPLGIGPEYSYIEYMNGIGYHSQIMDDLARYGLFAIAFYMLLFVEYLKLLKKQWNKIGMKRVALPIVAVYICFLILNPGFTSEHESIVMFFLIPSLPDVIRER